MNNTLLSLQNLSVGYGHKTVIGGVSLEVRAGEFCALLGLNGSGKTTLLKGICGLLPIGGGQCLVEGRDCTRFHEALRARYISYIPQRHSKLRGVTVQDVVLMGKNPTLGLFGSYSKADRQRARDTLETMGAGRLAGEDFSRLSEGQKQMVILSRALVQDTPVMLMDEPDSALDFLNRHRVMSKLRQIIREEKKAGLVALHDPNLALQYCDRLLILKNGELKAALHVHEADRAEVGRCLSILYGEIEVLEYKGRYLMVGTE